MGFSRSGAVEKPLTADEHGLTLIIFGLIQDSAKALPSFPEQRKSFR
jgi:hypothetical protein